MRHLLYIFLVISLTVCSCTSKKTLEVLEFKDSICCFDTIQAQQDDYCFKFIYYNNGTFPLYLTEVEPECSCTKAVFSKDALAPGDSAQIELYYFSFLQSFHVEQRISVKYYYNEQDFERGIFIKGYVIPRVLDL